MIPNKSQKKPIKIPMFSNAGAARFRLRKITDVPLVIFSKRRIRRQLIILKT